MADQKEAGPFPFSMLQLGIALGLLSAIGPISIDLYLPAFPSIAREMNASPGDVQMTLSVFFFALAAAQIPIGMMGDRFGRKVPLLLGLGLFLAASVACAMTSGITQLIALRFAQGFGVCAGTAVARAMIRDLASGHVAARLMANSFLIIGISPILAPLAGSFLLTVLSWRELFLVMALLGLFAVLTVHFFLPESLPAAKRVAPGTPLLRGYLSILSNKRFYKGASLAALATVIPFSYVTAAPFVFTGIFGLESVEYSLLLALNAACSIASTQFSPLLMKAWGPRVTLRRMSLLGIGATVLFLLLLAVLGVSLPLFLGYSMAIFTLAGLMLTPAAVSALDATERGVGAAAGTLGTFQMAITAAASALISVLPDTSLLPLAAVMAAVFLLSFLFSGEQAAK